MKTFLLAFLIAVPVAGQRDSKVGPIVAGWEVKVETWEAAVAAQVLSHGDAITFRTETEFVIVRFVIGHQLPPNTTAYDVEVYAGKPQAIARMAALPWFRVATLPDGTFILLVRR